MLQETEKTLNSSLASINSVSLSAEQRPVEGAASEISFHVSYQQNFVETKAFPTAWSEQLDMMQELNEAIEEGEKHATLLYSTRCFSQTFPRGTASMTEQESRNLAQKTIDLLTPLITSLKEFIQFSTKSVALLLKQIDKLINLKQNSWTDEFVRTIISVVDVFALLDALKDMKTSLNNDFTAYKRSHGILAIDGSSKAITEPELQKLLASKNYIFTELRNEFTKSNIYNRCIFILRCADYCVESLNNGIFTTPDEYFRLLRSLPLLISLLDIECFKAEKKKVPKMDTYIEVMKQFPFIPILGDMHFETTNFFSKTEIRSFLEKEDAKVFQLSDSVCQSYLCTRKVDQLKLEHKSFVSQYSRTINSLKMASRIQKVTPNITANVIDAVLAGLRLISKCTRFIHFQSAFKFAKPINDPKYKDASVYQRVLRYNYTEEDYIVLIEIVAIAKSLANTLLSDEALLFPVIRSGIHNEVQNFVQNHVREIVKALPLKKTTGTKAIIRSGLILLRNIAGDWKGGYEPPFDDLEKKDSKKDARTLAIVWDKRKVAPSYVQLSLMRNILYEIVVNKKSLSAEHAKIVEQFYANSFFYSSLLDLDVTIRKCCDMSDLWYREFYIEMEKKPQYGIDDSLPSILIQTILSGMEKPVQELTEYVLYPFDLYNDAGNKALHHIQKQFLFNEIEAETNLSFDQFLFHFSDHLVRYYIARATSMFIDQKYKHLFSQFGSNAQNLDPPVTRFEVITEQRTIQLLGRVINLNSVLGQRVITQLKERIDHAIALFESGSLCGICELETKLNVLRDAHAMLLQQFELEPFDNILKEVNESVSLASFHGRIAFHILYEVCFDIGPNFTLNTTTERYIRIQSHDEPSRVNTTRRVKFPYGTKALSDFIGKVHMNYNSFFGFPHISSILRVLTNIDTPMLVTEIRKHIHQRIEFDLAPFIGALGKGLPKINLPKFEYGFSAGYLSLKLQMKDALAYEELPLVAQFFSQIGNLIALLYYFDKAEKEFSNETFAQSASFLGLTSTSSLDKTQQPTLCSKVFTDTIITYQTHPIMRPSHLPTLPAEALKALKTAEDFYRLTNKSYSLFRMILLRLKNDLSAITSEWRAEARYKNDEKLIIDTSTSEEFYRVWAFIEFFSCIDPSFDNFHRDFDALKNCGDGLIWGGCTLVHILGQHGRYEATNYLQYLINVMQAEDKSKTDPDSDSFKRRCITFRQLASTLFHLFGGYCEPIPLPRRVINPPDEINSNDFK